jgi:hypothetical protein
MMEVRAQMPSSAVFILRTEAVMGVRPVSDGVLKRKMKSMFYVRNFPNLTMCGSALRKISLFPEFGYFVSVSRCIK